MRQWKPAPARLVIPLSGVPFRTLTMIALFTCGAEVLRVGASVLRLVMSRRMPRLILVLSMRGVPIGLSGQGLELVTRVRG